MTNPKPSVREKMIRLLSEVGTDFMNDNDVKSFELINAHDVHAYYRLERETDKVVYVQGYPGMSSYHLARVWGRLMDYQDILDIRKVGISGPGNEHHATIMPFENFMAGTEVPYLPILLENMIAENIPELIPVKKLNLDEKK